MCAEVIWLEEMSQRKGTPQTKKLETFKTHLRSLSETELIGLANEMTCYLKSSSNWDLGPTLALVSEIGERICPQNIPFQHEIEELGQNIQKEHPLYIAK